MTQKPVLWVEVGKNAWLPHVRTGGLSLWVFRSLRFSACAGRSGEVGATTPNHRVFLCLIKTTATITTRVLSAAWQSPLPWALLLRGKMPITGRCHEDKRGDVPREISFLEARISPLWVVLEPPFLSNGWGLYPSHRVEANPLLTSPPSKRACEVEEPGWKENRQQRGGGHS